MTAAERDPIGDRMKSQYENRTRYLLPRRTYTIIRIDGKAFHTFTSKCEKPFDDRISEAMNYAALRCCPVFQGCKIAYGQSDEFSFLLTDLDEIKTDAWFDGNIQKISSVSASCFTAHFNTEWKGEGVALFDARVFTVPDPYEVENYFIWRQQDAVRNSIQSLGQAHFSQKRLHGVDCSGIQDILMVEKGVNWNNLAVDEKRGRCVRKRSTEENRTEWYVDGSIPTFTAERDYLRGIIPRIP